MLLLNPGWRSGEAFWVRSTDIRKLNNAGEKFLTEEGVYALIFKSRKPEAQKFQKWDVKRKNSTARSRGIRKIHNIGEKFLTEEGVYALIFKSRKPEAPEVSKVGCETEKF